MEQPFYVTTVLRVNEESLGANMGVFRRHSKISRLPCVNFHTLNTILQQYCKTFLRASNFREFHE